MNDGAFEWDDAKAAQNYAKHGISFDDARDAFEDPFAIDQIDDRYDYGEERWNIIGMVGRRVLFVAYTMRSDRVRIISARSAEPYEEREYYEQNASSEA